MPAVKSGRKMVWVVLSVLMLGLTLLGGAEYCPAQNNNQLQLPEDIKGFIRFKDTAWACANLRLIDNAVMLPEGNSLSNLTGNALPENPNLIDPSRKMGVLVLDPKKVGKLAPVVIVPIKSEKDFIRETNSYPLAVGKNNWKVTTIAPTGPGFMFVNEAEGFTTYMVVYRPTNTAIFCADWQIIERLFFWLDNNGDQTFLSRKGFVGDVETSMDLQMLYTLKEKNLLDLLKRFNELPNNPLPLNENFVMPLLKEALTLESVLRFENNAVNYEMRLGLAEGGRIATFAKNQPPADQNLLNVMPKRTVRAKQMSLNPISGKMLADAVEAILEEPELQQIYKPQDLDKIATQAKLLSAGFEGDMLFGVCRTEKNDGMQFFAVIKTSRADKMRPAIKKLAGDFLERRKIEPPLLAGAFEPLAADGKIERERLTFKPRFEDDLKEEEKQVRLAMMGTLECSAHFAYPDGAILIAAGLDSENLLKEMIARYQKSGNAGSLMDEASFKSALPNLPEGWNGMHYFSPTKMVAGLKAVQDNLGDAKFAFSKVMAFALEKMVGDMPDIVCGMKYEKNSIVIKTKIPATMLAMLGTARQMFLKKASTPAPEGKAPAVEPAPPAKTPEKESEAPSAPADEAKKKTDDVVPARGALTAKQKDETNRLYFPANGFSIKAPKDLFGLDAIPQGRPFSFMVMHMAQPAGGFRPEIKLIINPVNATLKEVTDAFKASQLKAGAQNFQEVLTDTESVFEFDIQFENDVRHQYMKLLVISDNMFMAGAVDNKDHWPAVADKMKACVDSFAPADKAKKGGPDEPLYVHPFGVSIMPLEDPAKTGASSVFTMFLQPSNNFSPEVNITIVPTDKSFEAYLKDLKQIYASTNLRYNEVLDSPTCVTHDYFESHPTLGEIHRYVRAQYADKKIYLVTGNTLKSQWPMHAGNMKDCIESFRVESDLKAEKSGQKKESVPEKKTELNEAKSKAPEKKTDKTPEQPLKGASTFKLNGVVWPIDGILENTAQSKRITADYNDMPMSEFLKNFTELSGIATDWQGDAMTNVAKEGQPEKIGKVAENKQITIKAENAPPMAVLVDVCRQIGYSFEVFQMTKNDLSYLEVKVPGTFQKYPVKQFAANGPLTCEWYGLMRLTSTLFKKDAKEEVRYRYGLGLTYDPNSHIKINPDGNAEIPVKLTFPDGKTITVKDSKEVFSSSSKNWEIEPKAEWAGKTATIEVSVPYMAPTRNFSAEVNCAEQASVEVHDILVTVNKIERKEKESFGEKTGVVCLKTQIKLIHKYGPELTKIISERRQPKKEEEHLFQAADPEKAALALIDVVVVGKDGSEIPGKCDFSPGMSGLHNGYSYDLFFDLANKEFEPATLKVVWAGSYTKGTVDFKLAKVKFDPVPAEEVKPATPLQEEMIPESSREPDLPKK